MTRLLNAAKTALAMFENVGWGDSVRVAELREAIAEAETRLARIDMLANVIHTKEDWYPYMIRIIGLAKGEPIE